MDTVPDCFRRTFSRQLFRFYFIDKKPVQLTEVYLIESVIEGRRIQKDHHVQGSGLINNHRQVVDLILEDKIIPFSKRGKCMIDLFFADALIGASEEYDAVFTGWNDLNDCIALQLVYGKKE